MKRLLLLLIYLVFIYETGFHFIALANQAALKFVAICCLYFLHVGITRVGFHSCLSPPVKIKLEFRKKKRPS